MNNTATGFLLPNVMLGKDWKALELTVFRLLGHIGWKNLQYIGRSGDMGADILGVKFDEVTKTNRSYVFQVKAVSGSNSLVSHAAINQALEAQSFYGVNNVVVVTNGGFTQSAIERTNKLNASNNNVALWNGRVLQDVMLHCQIESKDRKTPFKYQNDIIRKVYETYKAGKKRALYVVATGLGKTVIAAEVARKMFHDEGLKRILVLCHSVELAIQLEKSFWSQIDKDIPTMLFSNGAMPVPADGINFGLYQSLYTNLGGYNGDEFDMIIVDEAHHALANTFSFCINHLKPKFLLGMTATPWRGNGECISTVFGPTLANVSLVQGMKMGRIAAVDYRIMCDNINWKEVERLSEQKVSIKDLNKRLFLPQRDDAVIKHIKEVAATVNKPKIAVFSPSIEHARRFAERLKEAGIKAGYVSSKNKPLAHKTLLHFSADELEAITAVDMLNEGIDVPDINIIVFLRATHSRRIFVQQLGRGLRVSGNKKNVIVLDFVSDIRRLAAVKELNDEAKLPLDTGEFQEVYLPNGIVSFNDAKTKGFIEEWLSEVTDLEDDDDNAVLTIPRIKEH